jgi:hypothetical protein
MDYSLLLAVETVKSFNLDNERDDVFGSEEFRMRNKVRSGFRAIAVI